MKTIFYGVTLVLILCSCNPDVFVPVLKSRDYVYIPSPIPRDTVDYFFNMGVSGGVSLGTTTNNHRFRSLYASLHQSHQWRFLGLRYAINGYAGSFLLNRRDQSSNLTALNGTYSYRVLNTQSEFFLQNPGFLAGLRQKIRLIGIFSYSNEFGDYNRLRQSIASTNFRDNAGRGIIEFTQRELFAAGGGIEFIIPINEKIDFGGNFRMVTFIGEEFDASSVEPFDRSAALSVFTHIKRWNLFWTLQWGNDFQFNSNFGIGYQIFQSSR